MRIIAIADSDSYVKWSAALLGTLPDSVAVELLILETSLVVSAAQQRSATAGSGLDAASVRRTRLSELTAHITAAEPDAVLLAARGPVVRVVARLVAALTPRPLLVTGLPGISIPETTAALVHRTQCDLFVLHSTREIRAFTDLADRRGMSQRFALAHLPFAQHRTRSGRGGDLVFAAQAIVPRLRDERLTIARMLVRAARAEPERRVVVKLRAVKGEHQTHRERDADSYPELLRTLGPLPPNLVISTDSMARALSTAEGLVTVSSTAAIEAIAFGVPSIALDTFGVSDDLINPVFRGSGLLAGEEAVISRDFRMPRPQWLADNYFHDPSLDDWVPQLTALVDERRRGTLPPKPPRVRRGGSVRDTWESGIILRRGDRTMPEMLAVAAVLPARVAVRVVNRVRNGKRRRPSRGSAVS
ncbi:hypothetical protein SAMN04489810_1563 [Microbacterium pygmaeum]|uniref:Uncharacterized protein n=2 Tax=Microbacterium pygmaeum TaxID=370764 RepID=A0A1G7XX09_9MICO|nr:hypothetical protein SAMN04489810_1563 [Microbacterium pygmaeum]